MLNTMTGAVRFRLTDILKERGIKQKDLSRLTGMSEMGISGLTGDVRQVRLDTIARLCDALNITPADLMEYIPEKRQ